MSNTPNNLVPLYPPTLRQAQGEGGGGGGPPPGDGDSGGGDSEDLRLAKLATEDLGLADRLIARFGEDLTATHEMGWGSWDGTRYYFENGEDIAKFRAHDVARLMRQKEYPAFKGQNDPYGLGPEEWQKKVKAFLRAAKAAANDGKTKAMLSQAQPYLRRQLKEFDAAADMMTCANGTLVLEDGGPKLKPPDRRDLLTKTTGVVYDGDAKCAIFDAHMQKVQPDAAMRAYVQRCLGYTLLSGNREQVFFIFQGRGGDGKSTTLNAVRKAIGEYAGTADISTFLHNENRSGSNASPDIARLATGIRLVLASEPEKGARLSGSVLKQVSGGEPMVARALHKDIFEFSPQWVLIISCNHKPYIGGDDGGIWRRTKVVPWPVQIAEEDRDKSVDAKLAAERSGVLNWLVDGYYDYLQRDGLDPPEAAQNALDDYRRGSNPFGEWYEECTVTEKHAKTLRISLYKNYKEWCEKNNQEPISARSFYPLLADRQHNSTRVRGEYVLHDIRLKDGRDT